MKKIINGKTVYVKEFGDEKTHLTLSDVAEATYSNTDRLDIYEEETENGYNYHVNFCGAWSENLTEAGVNKMLEELSQPLGAWG